MTTAADQSGVVACLGEGLGWAGHLGGAGDLQSGVGREGFGHPACGHFPGSFEGPWVSFKKPWAGLDGHSGVVGGEQQEQRCVSSCGFLGPHATAARLCLLPL